MIQGHKCSALSALFTFVIQGRKCTALSAFLRFVILGHMCSALPLTRKFAVHLSVSTESTRSAPSMLYRDLLLWCVFIQLLLGVDCCLYSTFTYLGSWLTPLCKKRRRSDREQHGDHSKNMKDLLEVGSVSQRVCFAPSPSPTPTSLLGAGRNELQDVYYDSPSTSVSNNDPLGSLPC